ncbi:MAG: alpha/beta hydrolase [Rhodospirillales bacterium]|nr:alpha/beta hydrolase [Rhodospirillales bacterium]
MRAKLPAREGFAERDGVKIFYEVYGDGPETMMFLPPWSIVHSRVYKAQVPYFSERFRCVTFDPRGNGKSSRPTDAAAYSLDNCISDVLTVMDATDADKAILVGLSLGGMHACVLAAHHPGRVKAAILAGTAATVGPGYLYLTPKHFLAKREQFEGWDKYNRDYWQVEYSNFAEHFVRNIFSDPHSTKQIEDGVEWANDTTGQVLASTVDARSIPPTFDVSEAMYRKIRCPMLVIHGDNDQIQPYARAQVVAELTNAELFTIPGAGTIRWAAFRRNATT